MASALDSVAVFDERAQKYGLDADDLAAMFDSIPVTLPIGDAGDKVAYVLPQSDHACAFLGGHLGNTRCAECD